MSDGHGKRKLEDEVNESWTKMESLALRLFAVSARIDDLLIRSQVDYLEDMGRQFVVMPGERIIGPGETRGSEDIVLENDQLVQGIAIRLNHLIGDRLLELLGSQNPELALDVPAAHSK